MIRRLARAYVNEGKIRMDITTWIENEQADMGLESVANDTLHLSVKTAERLITELKNAVYDYYEEAK